MPTADSPGCRRVYSPSHHLTFPYLLPNVRSYFIFLLPLTLSSGQPAYRNYDKYNTNVKVLRLEPALTLREPVFSAGRLSCNLTADVPTTPCCLSQALISTMDERRASSLLLNALPVDLLHHILEYCHSMADFSAVIRTSKRIYGVYKDHPSSILRSVACNHLGMPDKIFPFAFSIVLYYERARVFGSPIKDWLGEDDLSASHLNPSRFYEMVSNHDVVVALEKKFSQR